MGLALSNEPWFNVSFRYAELSPLGIARFFGHSTSKALNTSCGNPSNPVPFP
jgi:hypothetical protein